VRAAPAVDLSHALFRAWFFCLTRITRMRTDTKDEQKRAVVIADDRIQRMKEQRISNVRISAIRVIRG
jgi:hypothetical protein